LKKRDEAGIRCALKENTTVAARRTFKKFALQILIPLIHMGKASRK
jgi:hypothetical protein